MHAIFTPPSGSQRNTLELQPEGLVWGIIDSTFTRQGVTFEALEMIAPTNTSAAKALLHLGPGTPFQSIVVQLKQAGSASVYLAYRFAQATLQQVEQRDPTTSLLRFAYGSAQVRYANPQPGSGPVDYVGQWDLKSWAQAQ